MLDAPTMEECNYNILSGSTLKIAVPWSRPAQAEATDFTGALVVRTTKDKAQYRVPEEDVKEDGGRYIFTLSDEFTAGLPPGEHPYEAAAVAADERYTMRAGHIVVRDLGSLDQDERDLQCAEDLLSNRLMSGGDIDAYQFPGGASIKKMSISALQSFITQKRTIVNQKKGWYGYF